MGYLIFIHDRNRRDVKAHQNHFSSNGHLTYLHRSKQTVMQNFEGQSWPCRSACWGGSGVFFAGGNRNKDFKPTHLRIFGTMVLRVHWLWR